ncbi:MAG TPA: ATP-binding protein [Kofleriaceae bacterium]
MKRFRSLASRLVALGALQLALLVLATVLAFVVAGPRGEAHPRDHIDSARIAKLEQMLGQPAQLQAELERLRGERIEVSIYDVERQLVASNVDPALAIPRRAIPPEDRPAPPNAMHTAPRDSPRRRRAQPPSLVMPIEIAAQPGFLVARGVFGEPPGLTLPVIVLIASFAILAITALLTARWIVRPIDRLARTARAIGTGDLSARSRLDRSDEIGELGHQVDDMADRLANLLATERELLANVAHELRTPLSRIGVALDLAAEGDSDAARSALGEISVDVSELEVIVDDILTAMRFEVGRTLPLRKAVVTPASIVAGAADRFRARHAHRPLETEAPDDLPMLDVDPMLVRRVVDNLLENAHKYSPDQDAPIAVSVARTGDTVVFTVRDRGIGIAPDDLPRVFTAFFRGDRSRSRETGGVGLGLTLAKRIVEAHGGTIEIASKPNDGTTVTFALPAAG